MSLQVARSGSAKQRIDGAKRAVPERAPRFGPIEAWAFVVPALSSLEVHMVGRLILSEALMLVMLPWLWRSRQRLHLPRWLGALWVGWFVSQVVSDILAGTSFEDWARGWASIAFTLSNLAAILVLAATPRRARLFALGLAAGVVLGYLLSPSDYALNDPWKWAFAAPIGLTMAAFLSSSSRVSRGRFSAWSFVAFGALNLYLGFRSLGGISLLTGGYLLLNASPQHSRGLLRPLLTQPWMKLALLGITALGVLAIYSSAASQGLLRPESQAKYDTQSGKLGILVGGRSEILVSLDAIADSPLLGHGSWARDYAYVDLLSDRQASLGYQISGDYSDTGLIPAHSYLTGSWIWAGFLGGLFWIAITGLAVRMLLRLKSPGVRLMPLLVFSTMSLLWNIGFSPFGNKARILAAFGIALCILGLRLTKMEAHFEVALNSNRTPWIRTAKPASGPQFVPTVGDATQSIVCRTSTYDRR